jgi:hypothetical protein
MSSAPDKVCVYARYFCRQRELFDPAFRMHCLQHGPWHDGYDRAGRDTGYDRMIGR